MRQEDFKLIGLTAGTVTQRSHNAAGNNAGQTAVGALRDDTKIAAWLSKQTPADADRAAVLRALRHNVGLQVRYEGRFPSGPNGERLPSYTVAVACDVTPGGDHVAALADLRNFMVPAPQGEIEGWLAELSVIVAKRKDDAFDEGLRLQAYATRLRLYPADVARAAILKQPSWQFWPTWAELEKVCETTCAPRRRMINALENPPTPQGEPREIPSLERRKEMVAEAQRIMNGEQP